MKRVLRRRLRRHSACYRTLRWPTATPAISFACPSKDRVPAMSRDLPYAALDCAGISELHLLLVRFDGTAFQLNQRIEALFRRYGLLN
jgi:hypothetical protein